MNPDYAYTTAWRWAQKYEDAMKENERLRAIFPKIIAALESGSCSPDCSVEFLEEIPREVRLVMAKVREENKRFRFALERIERHGPIMGSTGDYRQGQLDILSTILEILKQLK